MLIKKFVEKFKTHDGILSNILILSSGTFLARFIVLLATPLITRLYHPDDFGVFGLFNACVALIVPLTTMRYHVAIPLPQTDRAAVNIVCLSLSMILLVIAFLVLIIFIGDENIFNALSISPLAPYRWLLLASIAGFSAYDVFQYWALRKKRMRTVALTQVMQSITGSGVKIILGLASLQPVGLLLGQIMQQTGGIVLLLKQFILDSRKLRISISVFRMLCMAKKYIGFPTTRLPSQLLLTFSAQLPLIFIANSFDTHIAGQFALAFSTMAMPVGLMVQSVGNAFYSEIAQLGKNQHEKILRISIQIMKKLALLALLPALSILLFGPWIFSQLFGESWKMSGDFAQLIAIFMYVQLITTPVMHILTVLEKHLEFLKINILRFFLVIIAFLIADFTNANEIGTVFIYSMFMVLHYSTVAIRVLFLR